MAADTDSNKQYKIHPIADLWPKMNDDERAATKASIKSVGIKTPVVFWKGPDGTNWLLDGRSRVSLVEELFKEGITHTDSGHALDMPAFTFQGTEREALEYVEAITQRRNLDPSQRAAVAVKSGLLARLYAQKESGQTGAGDKPEAGELAERVAVKAGTNRQYVYDCSKLAVDHPDLLDRVAAGHIRIPAAKKIADRRAQGLPDEEPEAGSEPETKPEVKPSPPKEVFDGMKNEVAPEHHAAFEVREKVRQVRKELQIALAKAQEITDGPGGFRMSWSTVKGDINNVRRHLEDHQPHAVCPFCSGTGEVDDPANPGAKVQDPKCGGKKYLDRVQWKEVPPEIRAIWEGQASTPASGEAPATQTESQPEASPAL